MIHGTIQGVGQITGTIQGVPTLKSDLTLPKVVSVPVYSGETEFTPSDEEQVIRIGGYRATQDITINPIPSNYGKIEWNGAYLTVS